MSSYARGAVLGDDYPARYRNLPWPYTSDNIWDQWNFAYRQCTSFVAWRLNNANGVPFSNQYKGLTRWGDAGQWADSARSVGVRVDKTPEVGAVAWSGNGYNGASDFGHVAWVSAILANGNIVVEEYNYGWSGSYHARVVAPHAFQGYIHVKDMTKPFTKTAKPTVTGAPMVGGTLSASVSGWSPAATDLRYQWMSNGSVIPGATSATFQPGLAELGNRISVEVTGIRPGYTATAIASSATAAVLMTDADGDGLDDTQQMLPWNSDVNGDGLPDAVGFASSGVQVALRTSSGFGSQSTWTPGFGTASGWGTLDHPRTLVDVNGDGMSDVVGFASDGVYVATSTGKGFNTLTKWLSGFGTGGGFSVKHHPRTLADVTGDGLPDVVAFASNGVYVAKGTGTGFSAASRWYPGFGTINGWHVDQDPRWLSDMNNDGKADIVGISSAGVYVALSTGSGFSSAKRWSTGFSYGSGWRSQHHVRTLADVNGDGRMDVVGFASDGVYVAVNSGSGLGAMTRWRTGFGTVNGWLVGKNPRTLADVNGDGRADVVGFSNSGVSVALSSGSSFGSSTTWTSDFGANKWLMDRQPRMVIDVNGDGKADIVGFDTAGVKIATSTGGSFSTSKRQLSAFGYSNSWRVASHPRYVGVETMSVRPTPKVAGQVRVGESVTASAGSWKPGPVKLAYQWLRDGKAITGQTSRTYAIQPSDQSTKISMRVTGTKFGYAKSSRTSTAYTVAAGQLASVPPTVSGAAKVGSTLTARAGAWKPAPVTLKYQWNQNGVPIAGATGATYTVQKADVARRITVTVTGSKSAYKTATATSESVKISGIPKVPKTTPFADVGTGHKFYTEIAWMYSSGLSTGIKQPAGMPKYDPLVGVSREAMAAFIFRLDGLASTPEPRVAPFIDVPANHKFGREIAWMRDTGLSTGVSTAGGKAYFPKSGVSREAMAAFLYRLETPRGFTPPATSPFKDVPTTHKFYREIAWMYESGLSTGIRQPSGRPIYNPKATVSREAMAAFLYRMETQQ